MSVYTTERVLIVALPGQMDLTFRVNATAMHWPRLGAGESSVHAMQEVLDFWFAEDSRRFWFASTPAFDQMIRKRFAETFARAAIGELGSWEDTPEGCVALCVLLDQMPRNMFRGKPRAYATDAKALAVAERAVSQGFDRALSADHKQFLYLPFMHSETLANQLRALALFESAGLTAALGYIKGDLAIIRRFGRFPHRNSILGRPSTPEELEYLAKHHTDRGQTSATPVAEAISKRLKIAKRNAATQAVGR